MKQQQKAKHVKFLKLYLEQSNELRKLRLTIDDALAMSKFRNTLNIYRRS